MSLENLKRNKNHMVMIEFGNQQSIRPAMVMQLFVSYHLRKARTYLGFVTGTMVLKAQQVYGI